MQYKIYLGQEFGSVEEANKYVKDYSRQEKQWFRIRTSGIRKKRTFKRKKEGAGTFRLLFYCKHGEDVRTRGTGSRKTKTCRLGCRAFINMIFNVSTETGFVKNCNLDHSTHPLTMAFYHLSREVRLDLSDDMKKTIDSKLQVDGNKKKIQTELIDVGKHISLRDLTNRKALLKTSDGNNLKNAIDFLKNEKKADVHVSYDDSGEVTGLFFCTEEMRSNFAKFPEIFGMDGTYQLTTVELTFVLLIVIDGEGSTEIVGAGLLAGEDAENFEWLLRAFVKCNPKVSETKSIMTDKCAKERAALSKVFPGVPLYICRFHTMQIFDRTLLTKMNKKEERDKCKAILQKMIYSSSEEEYMKLYEELCENAPKLVVQYFDDNWHSIRLLWCDYGMIHLNLGTLTNNRLESINQKLKQVICKRNSLMDFLIKFFEWQKSHLTQNDFKMKDTYCTKPIETLTVPSTTRAELYRELLTTEAFKSIEEHFDRCKYITFHHIDNDEKYCMLRSKTLDIKTGLTTCGCPFWKRMNLPCHHIFSVRIYFNVPLFEEALCHSRWKRTHSVNNHRLFRETITDNPHTQPSTLCITRRKLKSKSTITVPVKRRKIKKITDKITEYVSLLCGEKFREKEFQLQQFLDCLKNNRTFQIVEDDVRTNDHRIDDADLLAEAMVGMSFEDGNDNSEVETLFEEDDKPEVLDNLKMPSPIKYTGRPSQMSVTTPTVRKRERRKPVRFSPR